MAVRENYEQICSLLTNQKEENFVTENLLTYKKLTNKTLSIKSICLLTETLIASSTVCFIIKLISRKIK